MLVSGSAVSSRNSRFPHYSGLDGRLATNFKIAAFDHSATSPAFAFSRASRVFATNLGISLTPVSRGLRTVP